MARGFSLDHAVAELAARQRGNVTRGQLLNAGVGRRSVQDRVEQGLLIPVYRGVYRVQGPDVPWATEQAALLACGPDAHLDGASCGAVYGFAEAPGTPEVVSPRHIRRLGIRARRRDLEPWEKRERDGLRVTHPISALITMATTADPDELEQAIAQAVRHRLTTERAIQRALTRIDRHGVPTLNAAVQSRPALTRSEAERTLLHLIRRAGLPEPETNARVEGFEVDFLWRHHRLIVELDGFTFHGDRKAFRDDRERDGVLQARGFVIFRVAPDMLARPERLAAQLGAMLVTFRAA